MCMYLCTHMCAPCADAWRSEGGGRNLSITLCLLCHGGRLSPEREACNRGRLKAIGPSDLLRAAVTGMFGEVWLFSVSAETQALAS